MSSERVGLRNPRGPAAYGGATPHDKTTTLATATVVKGDYVSVPTSAVGGCVDGSDVERPYSKRPKFIRRSYLAHLGSCVPVRAALVVTSLALLALAAFTSGVRMGQRGLEHSFSGVVTQISHSAQADGTAAAATADATQATTTENTIVVGFQVRGDYGWLAVLKLVQAAFPGYQIKFANPGEAFPWIAEGGLGYPNSPIIPVVQAGPRETVDIAVEGPSMFMSPSGCYYPDGPWLWVIQEPAMFYSDYHCHHTQPPAVRMDTATSKLRRGDIYNASKTTFLWSPYANHYMHFLKDELTKRDIAVKKPHERPYLVAFLSANCQWHRTKFFNTFLRVSIAAGLDPEKDGIHALGPCNHNQVWKPGVADYPSKSLPIGEVYGKYRFVITMENCEETGYVTEKLGNALAGGGVPIYFGDTEAASRIFNADSYIDMKRVWSEAPGSPSLGETNVKLDHIKAAHWTFMAQYVLDLDKDPQRYAEYTLDNVLAPPERETQADDERKAAARAAAPTAAAAAALGGEEQSPYPLYFPRVDMGLEEQVARSPRVAEAVERLREQVLAGKASRAAEAAAAAAAALGRDRDSSSTEASEVIGAGRGVAEGLASEDARTVFSTRWVGAVVDRVASSLGFHWRQDAVRNE